MLFAIPLIYFFFFFNDTATTEIYTLSLHDALPICLARSSVRRLSVVISALDTPRSIRLHCGSALGCARATRSKDRKSTRLNSSHSQISYAVFCLKKKTLENERERVSSVDSRFFFF